MKKAAITKIVYSFVFFFFSLCVCLIITITSRNVVLCKYDARKHNNDNDNIQIVEKMSSMLRIQWTQSPKRAIHAHAHRMPSRPICGSGIVNGGHCCCSAFIFQNIFKTVFGFHFGPQLAPDAIVKHAMVGRYSTVLVQIDGSTLAHSVDTSAGGTKAFCLPSNRFQPAQILQRKK